MGIQPDIISVQASLECLKGYQLPLSVKEGVYYLNAIGEKVKFLSLYQSYFPQEWKQSTASLTTPSDKFYSPLEEEFFQLIQERLFPIGDEDSYWEERLSCIPIYPRDLDWWERPIDEFDSFHQFLISLYGAGYDPGEWQGYFGFTPPMVRPVEDIDWQKLEGLCANAPVPLCHLYDLLSIVDHSTGCLFIDTTSESYSEWEWSRENLDLLHQHWLLAQQLWTKEQEFAGWLNSTPNRYAQVVELFNQAVKSDDNSSHP